jgi:hypothetical protein
VQAGQMMSSNGKKSPNYQRFSPSRGAEYWPKNHLQNFFIRKSFQLVTERKKA